MMLILLAALAVAYLFYQGYQSNDGAAPGLSDGRLAPCPDKPNCVNSEAAAADPHAIAPLASDDLAAVKQAVIAQGGKIVTEDENYLAATFTSSLFRFVDDVEFRLDRDAGLVQVRSASRVGHSDLDANRKRVETLRAALSR